GLGTLPVMILSWSRGFIFIKGRKVGGTSVEMVLSTLCEAIDIVTPITQVDERQRIELGGRPSNFAHDRRSEAHYIERIASTPPSSLRAVPIPKGDYRNHMSLQEVLGLQPSAATIPMVFVERNPYAKILSFANHELKFRSYRAG